MVLRIRVDLGAILTGGLELLTPIGGADATQADIYKDLAKTTGDLCKLTAYL